MWIGILSVINACIWTFGGHKILDRRIASFSPERRKQYNTPLYDWIHNNTKDIRKYRWIPDYAVLLFDFYAGAIRPVEVEELMIMCGVFYTLRAILFCLTSMPRVREGDDREESCGVTFTREKDEKITWVQYIKTGFEYLLRMEKSTHSFDSNVSGHTLNLVIVATHWSFYQVFSPNTQFMIWITVFILSFMIIVCRCHVTQDVVLAWCIAGPTQTLLRPYVRSLLNYDFYELYTHTSDSEFRVN